MDFQQIFDVQQIIIYALGFTITIFGIYLIITGLWGVIKKRPLVVPASHYLGFMFAIFLLGLVLTFVPFLSSWKHRDSFLSTAPFVNLAMIILMIFMLRRQMSGYTVLGIYDDTFREALTSALTKLNLSFQENISKIRLTDLNIDLQATVASWMGTAQIHIKQSHSSRRIKDIANAMNDYFVNTPVKVNYFAFITYLILGVCLIILVIIMA